MGTLKRLDAPPQVLEHAAARPDGGGRARDGVVLHSLGTVDRLGRCRARGAGGALALSPALHQRPPGAAAARRPLACAASPRRVLQPPTPPRRAIWADDADACAVFILTVL